jgi:hypothetical protein
MSALSHQLASLHEKDAKVFDYVVVKLIDAIDASASSLARS